MHILRAPFHIEPASNRFCQSGTLRLVIVAKRFEIDGFNHPKSRRGNDAVPREVDARGSDEGICDSASRKEQHRANREGACDEHPAQGAMHDRNSSLTLDESRDS
mmetsp:Transcript_23992/g.68952  ORF Transcript_23992/g.68952 Transcript_23992/m.68952 type:complete len:105 (+) Transcript_23992:2504-2818(+)